MAGCLFGDGQPTFGTSGTQNVPEGHQRRAVCWERRPLPPSLSLRVSACLWHSLWSDPSVSDRVLVGDGQPTDRPKMSQRDTDDAPPTPPDAPEGGARRGGMRQLLLKYVLYDALARPSVWHGAKVRDTRRRQALVRAAQRCLAGGGTAVVLGGGRQPHRAGA